MKPQVTSSEIVHENPWYRIRHDTLQYPDRTGHYYVAETPKTALVIAQRGDQILMVSQYRYTMDKDSLEFPSGTIKSGETLEEAAKRELREETGFEATTLQFEGSFYSLNGFANNHVHVFFTNELSQAGAAELDPEEQGLQAEWIKTADLTTLIKDQTIQDGETMAAWMLHLSAEI
jgi:ADP-ribose pyrophosphatase